MGYIVMLIRRFTVMVVFFITNVVFSLNVFATSVQFSVDSASQLKAMTVWICTNPTNYNMGETHLLSDKRGGIQLELGCNSFGFFPVDPNRAIGKYVEYKKIGMNALNDHSNIECTLTFNGQVFALPPSEVVYIEQQHVRESNTAVVQCGSH